MRYNVAYHYHSTKVLIVLANGTGAFGISMKLDPFDIIDEFVTAFSILQAWIQILNTFSKRVLYIVMIFLITRL